MWWISTGLLKQSRGRVAPWAGLVALGGVVTGLGAARPPAWSGDHRRTVPERIYVDATRGDDRAAGTESRPFRTIGGAVASLPEPLVHSTTIELAPGRHNAVGPQAAPMPSLALAQRMLPGVTVKLVGRADAQGVPPTLAWEANPLIDAREGDWWLENLCIGSGSTAQRRGVMVTGPARVTLKNVSFRTRSQSDAGIYTQRGGEVLLRGNIRLNEHLHDQAESETFCGIIATEHAVVRFAETDGASLDIGNGSLSASYYGCIRLGCATARITSWGEQSNNLAINNGGRIDLHDTMLRLCARQKRNTPIGLEHDGHILGEGARVIVEGENESAIVLQKASTFTCNDIELRGKFACSLWASSGSMFVGRFRGDVGQLKATTGASINVEEIRGNFIGPAEATHGGSISLPDRDVFSR